MPLKMYWSGGIAHIFLTLAVVSFMHWLLYPQYPLDRGVGRPQNWYGNGSKEKNA
jgi:hypothetical protein